MKYNDFIEKLKENPNSKVKIRYRNDLHAPYDWWKIVDGPKGPLVLVARNSWLHPFILDPIEVEDDLYSIETAKMEVWAVVNSVGYVSYWVSDHARAQRYADQMSQRVVHLVEADKS